MASFLSFDDYAPSVIGQDKAPVDPASLKGKTIGLYFSAHWCGPCRSFTPLLAKKYQEIVDAGHPFEIIFVSADETEEDALEYFAQMPWKMINFDNRDVESQLSQQYEIRGIPSLVLVDENGQLITKDGRDCAMNTNFENWKSYAVEKEEKERKRQLEVETLKANFNVVEFFQTRKVVDQEGNAISADHLKGKIVGLYFSAHWCPPCRGFTPKLAKKYKAFIAENHPFEVIFISSDRDAASAAEYFAHMPWKQLAFDDRESKQLLAEVFEVSGIPSLVLVTEEGVLTSEGRDAIMSVSSFDKLTTFAQDQLAEAARLAELVVSMPEEVTLPEVHGCPLKKLPEVYRGHYGCDHCGGGGQGWVYHCDSCGFDVHPACILKVLESKSNDKDTNEKEETN